MPDRKPEPDNTALRHVAELAKRYFAGSTDGLRLPNVFGGLRVAAT